MSMIVLRRLRLWLAFLITVLVVIVVAEYSLWAHQGFGRIPLMSWIIIISDAIFFSAYTYSLKGKPLVNKFALCYLMWADAFLNAIFGFFALFEIALTLKLGPLQPTTPIYGQHGQHGHQKNIVIVSPDQPQGYNPGAYQPSAELPHQQNYQYPHYPQYPQYPQCSQYPQHPLYPQHQFSQAAPVPGGCMIEVQERHMAQNGQVLSH
ncbi:unnamed protein product [Mortierella alpina]